MKNAIRIAGALALGLQATAAFAAPVCFSTHEIVSSKAQKDGASILFTMRDGSVWRNDLHGRCPDLGFGTGFVWVLRNPNQNVCENEQSLRVLHSGQVCVLGKFTQVRPPPRK